MTSPHEQALAAAMDAEPFNNELTVRAMLEQGGAGYVTLESAITAYLAALPAPDLAEWEKAAEGVTPGPYSIWFERCSSKAEAIAELAYQVEHVPDQDFAGGVYLLNADGKCPATTGCGPTSKQNADWIARCSPDNVLSALRSLSAKLAAVERERDEARRQLVAAWNAFGPSKNRSDPPAFDADDLDDLPMWAAGDLAEQIRLIEDDAEAADAKVKALTERLAQMEAALEPFSDMAGELFARNWNTSDVVIALDNPGDPHRVTAGDFFAARRARKETPDAQ